MTDAQELAGLLSATLPTLARRTLILVPPAARPPPPGAWAPSAFCAQVVLRGRIEIGVPAGDGERWTQVTPRHLLAVCPGGWSPRTQRTARRHLSIAFGRQIQVGEHDTPIGGSRTSAARRFCSFAPDGLALSTTAAAIATCAIRAPRPEVLDGLLRAALPLLVDALRRSGSDDTVARIRAYLREHCVEDLQRDAVAASFGISGDHLTRLLRLDRGGGFVASLHRYRLDRALDLLREEDIPIAAVAERCGFGSPSYFIRLFRRHHDRSPSAWRRNWRRADGPAA